MSDLDGDPNCWFPHAQAHLTSLTIFQVYPGFIDIHQTVGTRVVVAANALLLQLFPGCIADRDVVELEPLVAAGVVYICPVVA